MGEEYVQELRLRHAPLVAQLQIHTTREAAFKFKNEERYDEWCMMPGGRERVQGFEYNEWRTQNVPLQDGDVQRNYTLAHEARTNWQRTCRARILAWCANPAHQEPPRMRPRSHAGVLSPRAALGPEPRGEAGGRH